MIPAEDKAERLAHESPEGRPANPGVGPRSIAAMLGAVAGVLILICIVIALTVSMPIGLTAAAFIAVALIVNPAVWSNASRAKERAALDD